MLYIDPSSKQTFTAHQAMDKFNVVPLRLPCFSDEEVNALCSNSFGKIVSKLLKLFLGFDISDRAIEDCLIKNDMFPDYLDRKTLLIKFKCSNIINDIYGMFSKGRCLPGSWSSTAIQICLLFGVYADLNRCGVRSIDMAVCSDQLMSVIPVYFARKMGLPINMIIVGSVFEEKLWKLLRDGQIGNAYCQFIAALLYTYDPKSAEQYALACSCETNYEMSIDQHNQLLTQMFCSVVSVERTKEIIFNIGNTYAMKISAPVATSYGALQDYRSVTGENNTTLILMEEV